MEKISAGAAVVSEGIQSAGSYQVTTSITGKGHSLKKERHPTAWTKLGKLASDFEWRGIAAEEFLRTPKAEPPELQTVPDMTVSDSYAVFRSFNERGQDQNVIRWLPVLLDATNCYFVNIEQQYIALADVPEKFGTFQRFERVPIKRLFNTATGDLVSAA